MDNENVCTHDEDDGNPIINIGDVLVREAGCGLVYRVNLEDANEGQWEIEMARAEAEKLYAVLGRMLVQPAVPATTPSIPTNIPWNTAPTVPNWINGANWQIPRGPWC